MPLMYCPVDRVIETTLGYIFGFKANQPLLIPPRLVSYVMERGALPFEGEEAKVVQATEQQLTDKQLEPKDPDVRMDLIVKAIKDLAGKGDLQYTAGGKPNTYQIGRYLKFPIDALERDAAWELTKSAVSATAG